MDGTDIDFHKIEVSTVRKLDGVARITQDDLGGRKYLVATLHFDNHRIRLFSKFLDENKELA